MTYAKRSKNAEALIWQMVETLKNFPKFTCREPWGCCETDYGEAVLAWKQKRDEQVAKAEKYLEVK